MSDIIDTGLGWWANEDWLLNTSQFIGSIESASGPSELPITAEFDKSTSLLAFTRISGGTYYQYIASKQYNMGAFMYTTGGQNMALAICSTVQGAEFFSRRYLNDEGNPGSYDGSCTSFVSDIPGVFYGGAAGSVNPAQIDQIYVPVYESLRDGLVAYVQHELTNFYKLNVGFSISCFMKWINANQEELTAPILISTDQNAIILSTDGSSPASGIVTGIDFGGMMFYINILLGYSGTVAATVPYQDITSTFPSGINITELFRAIVTFAQVRFSDPYREGGVSGPGGGGGTFDFTSSDIPIPSLPTIGAYDTGFISLYRPSDSELRALAAYLWSGPFDLDNFKKIFANPMDCILGLHIIPTAGAHPLGSASALMVGNISTGLSMQRLSEQYYELDCGTITIDPKWGAYLDYSPYSKLSLFLPYIGFVTISPDDCMNGSIRVVYHVDVLSGSCCVYVYCESNQGADGHTLYTFTGGCACDCPVTEGQYTNGLFGSLRGGIGLAAGLLSASPAGIMGGIEEAANAALSMVKPDVGRSGSFGGSAGLMGIQYPYLVLTIPKMCTPGDQNIYKGYPSFVTKELGNISGYASVEITHMENMSATDDEVTEIMGLLGEGVIF